MKRHGPHEVPPPGVDVIGYYGGQERTIYHNGKHWIDEAIDYSFPASLSGRGVVVPHHIVSPDSWQYPVDENGKGPIYQWFRKVVRSADGVVLSDRTLSAGNVKQHARRLLPGYRYDSLDGLAKALSEADTKRYRSRVITYTVVEQKLE
jgi:hypothetical protein